MDLNGRFRCSGKAVVRCSFLNAVVCWTLAESLGAFSALREAPRWRLITTEFDGAPFASFFATWLNHFCVFPPVFCLQRRPQPLCRARIQVPLRSRGGAPLWEEIMRKLRSTVSRLGPRGGSLQLGLLIGMTLSAVATGAQAATIFSTGFEPPDFTTGPLAGQQGWTGSGGTVETGTVFAGVQAVGFDTTGVSTQQLDAVDVPTAGQGSLVQVSDEFFVGAVNGFAVWAPLAAFGNAGFLGALEIDNGVATLGLADSSVGAVPVSIGAWNNYTMDFNFATGIQSAFVDGALIGTGPIATASTDVEQIFIGIDAASGSTAQGFADNVSLTSSVPEPSTWAMLLTGFAALGFMGFRRTRSRGVTA